MLPDCIAYDTERTGRRQAGVFTGVWTAGETLGLALGPGIYATGAAGVRLRLRRPPARRRRRPGRRALGVLLGFTAAAGRCWSALAVLPLRGYRDRRDADRHRTCRNARDRTRCRPRAYPREQVLAELARAAAGRSADARRPAVRLRLRPGGARARRPGRRRVRAWRRRSTASTRPPSRRLLAMENALVGAAAGLLGGGPGGRAGVVGSVTSGGTESLILAVKAARDARPELADPAAGRAGHRARGVRQGGALPAGRARRGAGRRRYVARSTRPPSPPRSAPDTVLVACSAPSYAHGVVDPVAEIAAAAAAAGVRCHVDACFGGWTLPYLRRLGADRAAVRLRRARRHQRSRSTCTSTRTPRRASRCCCTATRRCARRSTSRTPTGPGYTMINPVISSTRSGGPIAAAWATLRHHRRRRLPAAGRAHPGGGARPGRRRRRGGRAAAAGRAATRPWSASPPSPGLDLFVLADELAARGWHTQPQLRYGDLPASDPPDGDRGGGRSGGRVRPGADRTRWTRPGPQVR